MLTSVEVPDSAEAARAALQSGALPLGGGTQLMAHLAERAGEDVRLVSLRRAGLTGIDVDGGRVVIGAATTLADIEYDDRLGYLSGCVRAIASPPVRGLATVAGNLFVPQPYGDLTAALLALDAELDVLGADGVRPVALERVVTDGLPPGDLVTRIRFTAPAGDAFRFHKASRRRLNSAAIATVAARITIEDGVVADARIALGGLARHALRATGAERILLGRPLTAEAVARAAEAAGIEPFDDAYASAWYRARVFPVHLRRALLGS